MLPETREEKTMQAQIMRSVAVIYYSTTGTTARLAEAVTAGVIEGGANAVSFEITGDMIEAGRFVDANFLAAVGQADAVIMGSPTYMGGVSAQFKAFADATGELWSERAWSDKFAAGFTIGSNFSGDQLSTIQYLHTFANQHGMLWVSIDVPGGFDSKVANRLGAQSGLIAKADNGEVHADDLETARYLGERVAKLVRSHGVAARAA